MRIFLPLTPADLLRVDLPQRSGEQALAVPATSMEGQTTDEWELACEDALDEAAFRSLALLVDSTEEIPCRVVAVGEVPSGHSLMSWGQCESLHLDGPASEGLIEELRLAESQEEADRLCAALDEAPLEWFDISELPALRRRFSRG